jgi:hypothetical protein
MKILSTPFAKQALLALLTLLPVWAFGQQNFQPAKITTLTGDTLRGFINYRGWDKNPRFITFKTGEQATPSILRPLDIKEFRVRNERYVSAQVAIENSPQVLSQLTNFAAPVYRTDTTFLKALIVGPRSLYKYRTGDRDYFYTEQGGTFSLLVHKEFRETGSNGRVVIAANNLYRNQLALYLAGCSTIEKALQLLSHYTERDIQRVFAAYYTCLNQQPSFKEKKKAAAYQFGFLAGPSQATLSFNPTSSPRAPTLDKYTSAGVMGGVFLNAPLPGNLGHWSINNELTYNPFSLKASNESELASFYTKTDFSLAIAYLKLNTMLRFARPLGNTAALFANAGISNGYALQLKTEKTVTTKFPSGDRVYTEEAFPGSRHYEQGLVAGIGGRVKKLSAELRYERSNGFTDAFSLNSSFTRYSLLLGCRLR